MKVKVSLQIFVFLLVAQVARGQYYNTKYNGADVDMVTAPNGAVINADALTYFPQVAYTKPTVDKLGNGVYCIGGYSMVNCSVIETENGLIVFDCGDFEEEGARFRKIIEEQISKKPIIAIIYTHSHYALGAAAMVDNPKDVMIVGHPMVDQVVKENLESGGLKATIPELGPVMSARASIQFNNHLPTEGEDAPIGTKLEFHTPAYLQTTKTVQDGEKLTIDGLELQFFTKYQSDDYNLTIWVPSKKTVINNFFWPGTPNFYSIRGASYRDPQEFRDGLTVIRNLKPEYLVSTHTHVLKGQKEITETLNNYADMISLNYDQTLRGILHGLGPDELRYYVYKPEHLATPAYNKGLYGETEWFTPATFYYGLGWYDRDITKLFQIPVDEQAKRLVENMGGRERVLKLSQEAYDKKEYAWAIQLVNYLYKLDPLDKEVRSLKAQCARKLGQISMSFIGRSYALSDARALEGKTTLQKVQLPSADVVAKSPMTFLNYFRVRIDPKLAEKDDNLIAFTIGKETKGLHIRGGVAEYIDDLSKHYRAADIAVTLDAETWAKLYLNTSTMDKEIKAKKVKVTKGNSKDLVALYDKFDKFLPEDNFYIPQVK